MKSKVPRLASRIVRFGMLSIFAFISPVLWAASASDSAEQAENAGSNTLARLSIEGISANVGEDEPRVLTILPWRAPTLPRRPRAELESSAPELLEPLDPLVLERHRSFRQSLGVASQGGQPGARR
ncbi:hypothetical protein [Marinobacter salexigens]|uniref:hypothetical protein n=1 Tax=Marinobacter salexigens TaxID=1925763 RepID=UPI000C283BA8|nr:hypothetical protein [Marinobacter salexigens]